MSIVTKFIRTALSTFRNASPVGCSSNRAGMTGEQLSTLRKLKNADKLAKLKAAYGVGANNT